MTAADACHDPAPESPLSEDAVTDAPAPLAAIRVNPRLPDPWTFCLPALGPVRDDPDWLAYLHAGLRERRAD